MIDRTNESLKLSFRLLKESWGFVKRNKDLLLFPFLSLLGICYVIFVAFYVITDNAAYRFAFENRMFPLTFAIITVFILWFLFIFNIIFFNAACLGVIYRRMVERKNFSLLDGIRLAGERFWPLALWAAFWACGFTIIFFVIRWLERSQLISTLIKKSRVTTPIFLLIADFLNALTWFVLPIVVLEGKKLSASIRASSNIFKENWGKTFIVRYSVGACFTLLYLGMFLMMIFIAAPVLSSLAESSGESSGGVWGAAIFIIFNGYILFFIFMLLLQSLFSAVVRIALYHYVKTKQVVPNFDQKTLVGSFDIV